MLQNVLLFQNTNSPDTLLLKTLESRQKPKLKRKFAKFRALSNAECLWLTCLQSALPAQERVEEGEIDPHTPLFINITYTKKRPSFRQNSWCAKGRMLPWLGVLIKQYCRRFIPPSLYSLLGPQQLLSHQRRALRNRI